MRTAKEAGQAANRSTTTTTTTVLVPLHQAAQPAAVALLPLQRWGSFALASPRDSCSLAGASASSSSSSLPLPSSTEPTRSNNKSGSVASSPPVLFLYSTGPEVTAWVCCEGSSCSRCDNPSKLEDHGASNTGVLSSMTATNYSEATMLLLGLVVIFRRHRLLFGECRPALLDSSHRVARIALRRLLAGRVDDRRLKQRNKSPCGPPRCAGGGRSGAALPATPERTGNSVPESALHASEEPLESVLVAQRRIRFTHRFAATTWRRRKQQQSTPAAVWVWIQPDPDTLMIETSWESRLIAWENALVTAQSMAGYLSTLGGGYYLCHHWTTACLLAQRQQILAKFVLNDAEMYHKCRIHQAYSLAYGGHFTWARKLLRSIRSDVLREPVSSSLNSDQRRVLLRMCQSARLFVTRVQQVATRMSLSLTSLSSEEEGTAPNGSTSAEVRTACSPVPSSAPSRTVDDLARIRVYRDESRRQDVVLPFQRLSAV